MGVRAIGKKISNFQADYAYSGIIIPLRDIMYGLIYPAVLGTGLVLAVLRAIKEPSTYSKLHDSALYVAFASGLFYSFSFTSGSEKKSDKSEIAYRWAAFIIDFSEVILMFLCFYFLGLLSDGVTDPRLSPAYGFLLIDVVVIQILWRLVAGVDVFAFWPFRVIVATVLLAGILAGLTAGVIHPWVDLIVSLVVVVFVAFYVWRVDEFHFSSPRQTHPPNPLRR